MKIAVLYRGLDPRFAGNFAQDTLNREDDGYRAAIIAALRKKGHDAFGFQVREDHLQELQALECDLAFNLVDDGLNNDSSLEPHLPAILDVFGIPYTGGDFLSLAITLDKARTKEVLGYHGVPTPAFQIFRSAADALRTGLTYPLIVKPLHEDASIGVRRDSVVADEALLRRRVGEVLAQYCQPAIVEEYIHGRELSVGVIEREGRRIVTPMNEVVFNLPPGAPRIYSYIGKWDPDSDEYQAIIPDQCPPLEPLPAGAEEAIGRTALETFEILRLRGYARVDFRLREDGGLYVLEINANPLIGECSVMATMAERMGWPFAEFIHTIAVEAGRQSRHRKRTVTLRSQSC
ncbi:MAG: D-alanine--D-alanine ligase family protein [Candidatus Methylomirabilia bacterium]